MWLKHLKPDGTIAAQSMCQGEIRKSTRIGFAQLDSITFKP
jgi:hypothetical protein